MIRLINLKTEKKIKMLNEKQKKRNKRNDFASSCDFEITKCCLMCSVMVINTITC